MLGLLITLDVQLSSTSCNSSGIFFSYSTIINCIQNLTKNKKFSLVNHFPNFVKIFFSVLNTISVYIIVNSIFIYMFLFFYFWNKNYIYLIFLFFPSFNEKLIFSSSFFSSSSSLLMSFCDELACACELACRQWNFCLDVSWVGFWIVWDLKDSHQGFSSSSLNSLFSPLMSISWLMPLQL